ncbi:MAG TPA: NUDIX domain-containing protein [Bacteroidales bacterium]|nr:NUDIX domain-containing protein [Bacteroidales bacterium]
MLHCTEDRYRGITIQIQNIPIEETRFTVDLQECIETYKHHPLLWITIPIEKSGLIPILTKQGFMFHNCKLNTLVLVKKNIQETHIPTTKNYIVGVGAIVIQANKILVVQNSFSHEFALPGGHIEKGETIQQALQREVLEETGIDIQFESIVNIGHFIQGQFGESNLYIVCTAKPLHNTISIQDTSEIVTAQWLAIHEFVESPYVNTYNKQVVKAAVTNKDVKLCLQPITLRVPNAEVFF